MKYCSDEFVYQTYSLGLFKPFFFLAGEGSHDAFFLLVRCLYLLLRAIYPPLRVAFPPPPPRINFISVSLKSHRIKFNWNFKIDTYTLKEKIQIKHRD